MPRTSGRSAFTTESPIRCRPSERRVLRCAWFPPIFDLVWVTLRSAMSVLRYLSYPCSAVVGRGGAGGGGPGPEHGGRGHMLDRQPAPGCDLLGPAQALE